MNELPLNLYCHRKCLIDLSKLYSHSNRNVFRSATSAKPPFQDININYFYLASYLSFLFLNFGLICFCFDIAAMFQYYSRNLFCLASYLFTQKEIEIDIRNTESKTLLNIQILKEILRNFSAHNKKQHTTKVLSEVSNS